MSFDEESTSEQGLNLIRLPEIPLLEIGSYLNCRDLLNLSHTCRNLFHIFDGDSGVWLQALRQDIPKSSCDLLKEVAQPISKAKNLFSTGNWSKLATLMLKRAEACRNVPEQVEVTTFSRRFDVFNPPLYVSNYSDFFVVIDNTYEETEAGCRIQLKIWDVRSRTAKELSVTTVVTKGWQFPSISVFNDLVLMYSNVECQVVGFRINLGQGQLEEMWHRACPTTKWTIQVYERFFVFYENKTLEVYSTQDGSNIFTQNFVGCNGDQLQCEGDNDGWLVILFSRKLFAINFNLKGSYSLKRILALNDIKFAYHFTVVKKGKILHYSSSNSTAKLVDLSTNTCLREVKCALDVEDHFLRVDFDPKTNKIVAYSNNAKAWHILFQENNKPAVHFRYTPESDQEIEFLPQRMAILECKMFPLVCPSLLDFYKQEPNGQYSLRLRKMSGATAEEEIFLVKGDFAAGEMCRIRGFLRFQRVSPFLITFQSTGLVVVCDSLRISQYVSDI